MFFLVVDKGINSNLISNLITLFHLFYKYLLNAYYAGHKRDSNEQDRQGPQKEITGENGFLVYPKK